MEHEQQHMSLEDGDFVHVSSWDDGKVWMNLSLSRASARVILTKDEAESLIKMLQKAMA